MAKHLGYRHYLHTLYNRESNGWDRWRIRTDDQNFYYRALSENEKDFALQTNWTLTCECALERGGGFADIDLGGKGPRFDIEFLQEGDRYFVALTKQISPRIEMEPKIEFPGVADVAHPHTYELRYDHLVLQGHRILQLQTNWMEDREYLRELVVREASSAAQERMRKADCIEALNSCRQHKGKTAHARK